MQRKAFGFEGEHCLAESSVKEKMLAIRVGGLSVG